jgi:hypothetical protein
MSPKGVLIGVLTLLALGCGAGAVGASAGTPPRAALEHFGCHRALDPPTRAVAVTAVMRPEPGTERMQMRVLLLRRLAHHRRFQTVHGGDLGRWISPRPATLGQRPDDVWNLIKQVANLAAPAWYRFRVTFRWTGADGQRLGESTLESPTCYEPELRPDLVVRSIAVRPIPGKPTEDAYIAQIGNAGGTAAGPFRVVLSDGGAVQTATIARLAPHSTAYQRFVGAVCNQSNAPTVTVDPNHRVDDANRANNTRAASCPGS